MNVTFMPANKTGECKSIEMHHEEMDRHYLATTSDSTSVVSERTMSVVVMSVVQPTIRRQLQRSFQHRSLCFSIQVQSPSDIPCLPLSHCTDCLHVYRTHQELDPFTGQTLEENPTFLKAGDAAIIKCHPTKPLCLENAKEFPQLGRFAIRDMGQTIAAGMCINVVKKQMR